MKIVRNSDFDNATSRFPRLMKDRNDDAIMMVTAIEGKYYSGTVIDTGRTGLTVGDFSDEWSDSASLDYYTGTLTISN